MTGERLQKILARAGIASRRKAEELIRAGRVRVEGRVVTELGVRADPRRQRIELDGRRVVAEPPITIVLHKPRGVVSTLSDPQGRPTVADLVKGTGARVVPIGRLDFHTSGVLLLTNDGDLVDALAHPRGRVPKVYVTKVAGVVDDAGLETLRKGILIEGRPTRPAKVRRLRTERGKTWLEVTLHEGKNRQVRRMGEAAGYPVMRLARTEYAGITAEDLRPGEWRPLTREELGELRQLVAERRQSVR
jgi:23S rRNA pseudouridine2605 synthase